MNSLKIRELHRDLGYFYIGLIISFALSGILMNHRDSFHAEKYTTETRLVVVKIPQETEINIYEERNKYSTEFLHLLKAYYLHL